MFYPAENAKGARGFKVKNIIYLEEFVESIRIKDKHQ